MSFNYYTGERKDSVDVFTSNDTLHINFVTLTKILNDNQIEYGDNITLQVGLSAFNNLVVDGAVVVIELSSFSRK